MPRFMVEINRRAYEALEVEARLQRRTPQDQAGIILEGLIEGAGTPDEPGAEQVDPIAATAADPKGDMHKPR